MNKTSEKKKNLNIQTLLIYWRHVRVYWPMLILCFLGAAIAIICDLVSPMVYKRLFDQLAIDSMRYPTRASVREIYKTIIWIGAVMAISWSGWRVCMFAVAKFESRTMKDLTDYCFSYLQNHSHKFFTDNFAGALVKRINRFAAGFEVVADQIALNLGQTVVRVVLIICVLFSSNTTIGWVFLTWALVFICFNFAFAIWKLKYDLTRAEMDTKVTAQLSDTITNAINLKLFAGINREIKDFGETTENHHKARYKTWNLGWYSEGVQGLSIRVLEIIVLVLAVRYWLAHALTIGDFILLRSYLSQLTEEVRSMGGNIRRIYEAMADANEMTKILLRPHEVVDRENASDLSVRSGVVEFKNVSFSYLGDRKPVLRNFSLKINQGERIGIVGPSGGGKSTILKVLVRLHDIDQGEILIDGQNIVDITQDSLHRNIAFVPQDPILFHRTLLENIQYSRPEASDEEVVEAAKLAHCHEFISSFRDGYQTLVGERGVKLSGGERQRVAIARAILMNAPIIVLDEATSSLDSESEKYIQDSLSKLFVGKTVIVVAHRLSTIRKMDRIIVVKDGHVVEEGKHELLAGLKNGHYQKLWNLQSEARQEAW